MNLVAQFGICLIPTVIAVLTYDHIKVKVNYSSCISTRQEGSHCELYTLQICHPEKDAMQCITNPSSPCFVESVDQLNASISSRITYVINGTQGISTMDKFVIVVYSDYNNEVVAGRSCESSRANTSNGIIVYTSTTEDMLDYKFNFTIEIETECKNKICNNFDGLDLTTTDRSNVTTVHYTEVTSRDNLTVTTNHTIFTMSTDSSTAQQDNGLEPDVVAAIIVGALVIIVLIAVLIGAIYYKCCLNKHTSKTSIVEDNVESDTSKNNPIDFGPNCEDAHSKSNVNENKSKTTKMDKKGNNSSDLTEPRKGDDSPMPTTSFCFETDDLDKDAAKTAKRKKKNKHTGKTSIVEDKVQNDTTENIPIDSGPSNEDAQSQINVNGNKSNITKMDEKGNNSSDLTEPRKGDDSPMPTTSFCFETDDLDKDAAKTAKRKKKKKKGHARKASSEHTLETTLSTKPASKKKKRKRNKKDKQEKIATENENTSESPLEMF